MIISKAENIRQPHFNKTIRPNYEGSTIHFAKDMNNNSQCIVLLKKEVLSQ